MLFICQQRRINSDASGVQRLPSTLASEPRQSVGKGRQTSICPWALWLSKVETVFKHGFKAIYPRHHSGVEGRRSASHATADSARVLLLFFFLLHCVAERQLLTQVVTAEESTKHSLEQKNEIPLLLATDTPSCTAQEGASSAGRGVYC